MFEDIAENNHISFPVQKMGISSESIEILRRNNIHHISFVFDIIEKLIKKPNKNEIAVVELLEKVIQYTPDKFETYANEPDTDGNHLLLYLIGYANVRISLKIIQSGKINLNFLDKHGRNSLMCAVIQNLNPVINELLKYSSSMDLQIRDKTGYDILYYAIQIGNIELVEHLLSLNIFDLTYIFPNGYNYLVSCIEKNRIEIGLKIIDLNPSTIFFYSDEIYYSILHRAIIYEKIEIFMKMLEYKHMFTTEYINMKYDLSKHIFSNDLSSSFSLNIGNDVQPKSALELCIYKEKSEFMIPILETGLVSLDVLNEIHMSDTYITHLYNHFEENVILKCIEYTSDLSQQSIQRHIFKAAYHSKYHIVKYLLDKLNNFLIVDNYDNTLLLYCCKNKWIDLAEWILDNTFSNYLHVNKKKESAFLWCCIYNFDDLCKKILKKIPSSSTFFDIPIEEQLQKCKLMVVRHKNEELKQLIEVKLIEIRLFNGNKNPFHSPSEQNLSPVVNPKKKMKIESEEEKDENINLITSEMIQKIKESEETIREVLNEINSLSPLPSTPIQENQTNKPKIVCISKESNIQDILDTIVSENVTSLDKLNTSSSGAVEVRIQKPSKLHYIFKVCEVSTNIF